MSGFLPDIDPVFGIVERYAWDHESKSMVVTRTQRVQAILDNNREIANANDQGWRKKPDRFMLFASIPNVVIEQWMKEGINVFLAENDRRTGKPNEHMVRVLRKLEDPDWRHLKATSMRMA